MRSTDDGATWSAVVTTDTNAWQSIAYGNNIWVAVASLGTNRVMRSIDDGITWTAVPAADDFAAWWSIAYADNIWVAVAAFLGVKKSMYSLNDGISWKALTVAENNQWRSVASGNYVWIAVSTSGTNRIMRNENKLDYTFTGTGTTSVTTVTMTYNDLFLGI
jgi:hypothetical protein